jgi:hypothetical protein
MNRFAQFRAGRFLMIRQRVSGSQHLVRPIGPKIVIDSAMFLVDCLGIAAKPEIGATVDELPKPELRVSRAESRRLFNIGFGLLVCALRGI